LAQKARQLQSEVDELRGELEDTVPASELEEAKRRAGVETEAIKKQLQEEQDSKKLLENNKTALQREVGQLKEALAGEVNAKNSLANSLKKAEGDLSALRAELETERNAKGKAEKSAKKAQKEVKELKAQIESTPKGVPEEVLKKVEDQLADVNKQLDLERQARTAAEKGKSIAEADAEDLRGQLDVRPSNI